MVPKVLEKAYAMRLRKNGYSYNEILERVPVSKSSLSLWLSETPLSENERRLLKTRKEGNISRGRLKAAAAHRANREKRDRAMLDEMRRLFEKHKTEPFFTAGIVLYWAEGTKRGGGAFMFTNTDPQTHSMMLDWLERYVSISRVGVAARLYSHRPFAHEHHEDKWARDLNIPRENFRNTVFKPTGKLVKKRSNYQGCLRLELTSGLLGRKMGFLTTLLLDEHKRKT